MARDNHRDSDNDDYSVPTTRSGKIFSFALAFATGATMFGINHAAGNRRTLLPVFIISLGLLNYTHGRNHYAKLGFVLGFLLTAFTIGHDFTFGDSKPDSPQSSLTL